MIGVDEHRQPVIKRKCFVRDIDLRVQALRRGRLQACGTKDQYCEKLQSRVFHRFHSAVLDIFIVR